MSITTMLIVVALVHVLFGVVAMIENREEETIYCLVKSEKIDGVPEWTYIKHSSNKYGVINDAERLESFNTSKQIRYIVVPLTVKVSPFMNESKALKKEYERRELLVVKNKAGLDCLF